MNLKKQNSINGNRIQSRNMAYLKKHSLWMQTALDYGL